VAAVDFDEDFVCLGEKGGGGSDAGGEEDFAIGGNVGGFDDGPVHFSEEAVAQVLRQQGKVHVEEMGFPGVDAFAQILVRLIGRAELDGIRSGEFAIEGRAGGGAGDDADFKFAFRSMFDAGLGSDGGGDDFGGTGWSESAEADDFVMVDQGGCFVGS